MSLYWSAIVMAGIAGIVFFVHACIRRRGLWWKALLSVTLLCGPYFADVVRVRWFVIGESPVNAMLPTTLLLQAMSPTTDWPYGIVFDRLHKAPPRHAMWASQLDQFAAWCGECIAQKDSAMATRGVQIAGTLAGKGCDAAIPLLGDALMHADLKVRTLAMDVLTALGPRAALARAEIEAAAKDARDEATRQRAAELLRGM